MQTRPEVEIVRSARRRRSVSASWQEGRIVVRVPASISRRELDRIVPDLVEKVLAKRAASRPSDAELARRAELLSQRYLQGRAVPTSVRWVTNQRTRWGSCTTSTGAIRLSHRLQGMPQYVVDSVLLHELAHLIEPGHGPRFKKLLAGFERAAEADAYLAGAAFAAGWESGPDDLTAGGPSPD